MLVSGSSCVKQKRHIRFAFNWFVNSSVVSDIFRLFFFFFCWHQLFTRFFFPLIYSLIKIPFYFTFVEDKKNDYQMDALVVRDVCENKLGGHSDSRVTYMVRYAVCTWGIWKVYIEHRDCDCDTDDICCHFLLIIIETRIVGMETAKS